MADDAPQPLDELLDQPEETSDQEKPGGKLPLRKIATFAVVACVAVGAAWAAAGMLSAPGNSGSGDNEMIDPGALPGESAPEPERAKTSKTTLYEMDSIIVNLRGTEGRRYLKATIVFALKENSLVKELNAQKLVLTDTLIMLLSSKKIEDIDGSEKKRQLKREIRDEVNNLLGMKDAVMQVLFTEFIIQ